MRFGQAFFDAAVDACRRLNRRGLLLTRHTEHLPKELPASLRHVRFAPFSLLLPRCAAPCTTVALEPRPRRCAGVPQLMMPMSHDQFDNAAICRRLGVARSIGRRRFSGRRVAAALGELLRSSAIRAACDQTAGYAGRDDALGAVVSLLETIEPSAPAPSSSFAGNT